MGTAVMATRMSEIARKLCSNKKSVLVDVKKRKKTMLRISFGRAFLQWAKEDKQMSGPS